MHNLRVVLGLRDLVVEKTWLQGLRSINYISFFLIFLYLFIQLFISLINLGIGWEKKSSFDWNQLHRSAH